MTSAIGYSHEETIQKLERLNQLETVTAEQRIRIEKYRTMYETLKAEHEQVEDEKEKHSTELLEIREEMKSLQSQCQNLVSQARAERDLKVAECEEIKLKVLTPQKMEVLKIKLQEEVELPYKQKLEALEIEVDRYRNEFNHLRYDYSFLKSEYEHEIAQKKTVLDEICGKFELEKETLQKQISSLTEEINSKVPGDMHKLRLLQKENTQLNLTVKSLKDEADELRNKNEYSNVQIDQASRLQARQLSELSIQCKALESEKDTAKLQLDRVQKELDNSIREQDKISTDLNRMERENLQLKSQIEEMSHCHKMDLNNIKLDLTKDRCELEQEKDRFQMEMNMFKSKATIQESNILDLKKNIDQKEQEATKRVQAVREEEWSRINKLECEKAQLESQLSSSEQQRLEMQSAFKSLQDQMDDRQKTEQDNKEKHDREISNLRNQVMLEKQKCNSNELELEKLSDLKAKHQKLIQGQELTLASQTELKNDIDKLQQAGLLLRKELDLSQADLHTQRELHQKNIQEIKKQSENSKHKLTEKLTCLDKEYKELKDRYEKLSHNAKKKTKKLKSELEVLHLEVEELKAKEAHHQLEKQALMKNMSVEQERMRRKFDKFRHRQQQFSHVLNTSNFNGLDNFNADPRKTSSFLNQEDIHSMVPPPAIVVSPISNHLGYDIHDVND